VSRPQHLVAYEVGKARRDAYPCADAPEGAFEHGIDAKPVPQPRTFLDLRAEGEAFRARSDLKPINPRQCLHEVIGEPMAQIVIARIAADIDKGQHRDALAPKLLGI